jgi:hypothetical protein
VCSYPQLGVCVLRVDVECLVGVSIDKKENNVKIM